jgi:hypothetical protein
MDADRFDALTRTRFHDLITRLSTAPLSQSSALRRLAATVAALAALTLGAEPGADRQKKKVCHCTNETATSCKTIKVGKKAAK